MFLDLNWPRIQIPVLVFTTECYDLLLNGLVFKLER